MKLTMILTLAFGFLFFSPTSFAEGEAKQAVEKKSTEQTKSPKKKTRRKKALMCQECGKPETECDCEGEEHGVDHEHHEKKKD